MDYMNNPTEREQRNESPRIYTKCPACGNDTLTINDDKHLLCTWINCPDPTAIDNLSQGNEDTARLDWLDATPESIAVVTILKRLGQPETTIIYGNSNPQNYGGPTFRAAIDAARGVQPAAKEETPSIIDETVAAMRRADARQFPAAQQESAPAAEQGEK